MQSLVQLHALAPGVWEGLQNACSGSLDKTGEMRKTRCASKRGSKEAVNQQLLVKPTVHCHCPLSWIRR